MKKLIGLLAFALALVGAILLTQYYTKRYAPPPPPPPAAPAPPASGGSLTPPAPPAPVSDAGGNVPVSLKVQLATLDSAATKGRVTLALERDPAQPAPQSVWVWAYFFTTDASVRTYCAGDPVEVRRPFASGSNRAEVKVEFTVRGCSASRKPLSYYTRVNVSTESAFAARLTEQRISYDISQASPVVVEGVSK